MKSRKDDFVSYEISSVCHCLSTCKMSIMYPWHIWILISRLPKMWMNRKRDLLCNQTINISHTPDKPCAIFSLFSISHPEKQDTAYYTDLIPQNCKILSSFVNILVVFVEGLIHEFQYSWISDYLYELWRKILWPRILNHNKISFSRSIHENGYPRK